MNESPHRTDSSSLDFREQAFDALLDETIGQSAPPDLTKRIIERWRTEESVESSVATAKVEIEPRRHSRTSKRSPSLGWILTIVAVLATILSSGWWIQNSGKELRTVAKSSEPDASVADSRGIGAMDPSAGPSVATDQVAPPAPRPRGPLPQPIELAGESVRAVKPNQLNDSDQLNNSGQSGRRVVMGTPKSLKLVSRNIDQNVSRYWAQLDIEPTPASTDRDWWNHWSKTLGVAPPPAQSAPELLDWTTREPVRRAIATKWMSTVFGRVWKRIRSDKRDELIAGLVEESDLSKTISTWIRDPSHPIRTAGGQSASIRRVASLTLAADLRCNQCHDGLVDRSMTQADHWSLVSVLSPPSKDVFYEGLDGRRVVATKQLPKKWTADDQAIDSASRLADSLIQSRLLAAGVVDSMWSSLFGRPPHGSLVDFDAVIQTPALGSMREELIDDLIASRFDWARTAALMMDSAPGHRTVPAMYRDGSWAIMDRDIPERQIDAFAALPPVARTGNLGERIAWNLRAMGRKLDRTRGPLLAQMRDDARVEDQAARMPSHSVSFGWDYPDGLSNFPATWLQTIPDANQRLDHLAYLDGRESLPAPVVAAAEEMAKNTIDESLRLSRIWWMLRE